MTISTTGSRISYNGNGVTTAFSFPYFFFANADLVVSLVSAEGVETAQVLSTHYTVTGAGDEAGGTVNMIVAPASGVRLVVYRDTAVTQETDYISGDAFPAETHERALDKLTVIAQENADELARAIKAPSGDPTTLDMTLASAEARANSFMYFDSNGEPAYAPAGTIGSPSVVTRQQFSGDDSTTVFALASDPGASGASVVIYIGGVYQQIDTYSIVGSTLTFTEAPPAGTENIEVVQFAVTNIGETDAGQVSYIPAGTGAVATTVQSKLRQFPTIEDFGATSSFTVTVGPTGRFPNLQTALNWCSKLQERQGVSVTVELQSGFVMQEGFRIDNVDLDFVTITSVDPVVTVSPTFVPVSNTDLSSGLRTDEIMFLAVQARMPRWNILVDATNISLVHGYDLFEGSYGYIFPNKGVINLKKTAPTVATGVVVAYGSTLVAPGADFSGNDTGVAITLNSTGTVASGIFDNNRDTGIDVSRGSVAYANDAIIGNTAQGIYVRRSWCSAQGLQISNVSAIGVWSATGSCVIANQTSFTSMGLTALCGRTDGGSRLDLTDATKNGSPLAPLTDIFPPVFNAIWGRGSISNEDFSSAHATQLNANITGFVTGAGVTAVPALSYQSILSLTGNRRILGGSIYGTAVGVRITIDGVVVLNDTTLALGKDSVGDQFSVAIIPPCECVSSISIELYNRSGAVQDIGWKIYRQT